MRLTYFVDNWESQLSPVEKNTFVELFKKVDADNKGIVLQDEAFPFFKTSNIPENILTQVRKKYQRDY